MEGTRGVMCSGKEPFLTFEEDSLSWRWVGRRTGWQNPWSDLGLISAMSLVLIAEVVLAGRGLILMRPISS